MSKGYIYIMSNPALKDMVKIGFATDVEARRKQLSTTALPYEYEVYATYETQGKIEDKKLHKLIDNLNPDLRVSKNREFFVMTPEEAYELLESIAFISGTRDKLKRNSIEKEQRQIIRKPQINFGECGIPIGAELVYIKDPSIKVTVISERKVQYRDEITSLAEVANLLTGHPTSGPQCFSYNGILLNEIANKTQWSGYQDNIVISRTRKDKCISMTYRHRRLAELWCEEKYHDVWIKSDIAIETDQALVTDENSVLDKCYHFKDNRSALHYFNLIKRKMRRELKN